MDAQTKINVINLATKLIEKMIVDGVIPNTDESIKAAMPQVIADAKSAVAAAEEFICG